MDTTQQGIIALLKSAITGESQLLPAGFDLENADPLVKSHHMQTLIYEGAVRCGIPRDLEIMQTLFRHYCKALMKSEKQMRDVRRIFAAFDENGIDYMPLKGCNMKTVYPKPELRMMGDADILIRLEQYGRIAPLMEQLGFTHKQESDHELVWVSDNLFLELHKRLIPSYNKDYYAYFGDGWQLGIVEQGTRYTMAPEDQWIYLFTHFAKHYRDGGIGCRHVVDLWVWLRSHEALDWGRIEAELKKLQLLEFYGNVRRMIKHWFEAGDGDEITEFMTQFIMDSGSWGRYSSKLLSAGLRSAREAGSFEKGQFRNWILTIFPPSGKLARRYPILKRVPWLLPLLWPCRWIDALLRRRDAIRRRKRAMDFTTEDRVAQRREALRFVGLDYNFE